MRKMAIPKATGAVLLLAAVLAVTGCGGSKKSSTPPPVTVTVAPTTPATTTTAAATTTTDQSTTTAGSGTGSLKDCGSLTSFGQEFAKAIAASSGTGAAGLGTQAQAFKTFADKAPQEIRGDMRVIADALAKYAEALKGVNLKAGQTPSPDVIAKLTAAAKEINQPAVSAAGRHMSAWVASHCHA